LPNVCAQVSDNSGAKIVQCIQKSGTQWTIGDIIAVAVKKARGGKVCACIGTVPFRLFANASAAPASALNTTDAQSESCVYTHADAWHLMVLSAAQVAAGSVQKAVIVETKKEFARADGSLLRFDRNACVLVSDKGQPIGTRVLGFVTHELRSRNLLKVSRGAHLYFIPRRCAERSRLQLRQSAPSAAALHDAEVPMQALVCVALP